MKVDARARELLKSALARTVTLGGNLATTAVQAARQGVVDAAEATPRCREEDLPYWRGTRRKRIP